MRLPLAFAVTCAFLAGAPRLAAQDAKDPAAGSEASPAPRKATPKTSKAKKPKPDSAAEARRKAEAEIEALKARLAEQDAAVAKQQETIRELEERLARLEALAKANLDRIAVVEQQKPQPELSASIEERLRKLETDVRQLPEATDLVSVGDFPGSFRIPGTDAALKVGGQVRVTAVESIDAIGTDDRFVTSSIPMAGTEAAGQGARTTISAAPSRFNLDFRTPTGVGAMRAFIEVDFGGPNGAPRLRHAFGQWGSFLLGQTWSTFADPEAEPFGIDFEGLNAISLFRQPQIRYTTQLSPTLSFAASLENPAPDVTNASGVNLVPDLVLRLRWSGGQEVAGLLPVLRRLEHVQASVLVRQIRAEPTDRPTETLAGGGVGVGVSGVLRSRWRPETDDIKFSAYAGKGIGRYITDLGTAGGQDAYYDPLANELSVLTVAAAYLGYEHSWSRVLRSTVTFGWVWVDLVEAQPASALKETLRTSLNIAWSPVPRLDFVAELLTGKRVDKDLQRGRATQIQLGSRFRF
jgi:hypothetical protein